MLKVTPYNNVLRFDLARNIAGRPLYWTTAYFVDGMMIDTGCAHTAPELVAALKDKPLANIVNTHSHEDHIGANGVLQGSRDPLELHAHPLALPVLADPRGTQPLRFYRRLFWGWPEPSSGRPLDDGALIETDRHRFRVIYTPGHSPDHICLFEEEQGWLFTGDLFVGGRERALRVDFDIGQIIASLRLIAKLPVATLFPGSARVRENPAEELEAKLAYFEDVGERVVELHRQGQSPRAIARDVFGGPMWVEVVTAGHFSRQNLVRSFLQNRKNED